MVFATSKADNGGKRQTPYVIWDIDGPIHSGIYDGEAPRGVDFVRYLTQESLREEVGEDVEVSFSPDGVSVGGDYEWGDIREALQETGYFGPDEAENINEVWHSGKSYAEKSEEIGHHYMMGVRGREREDIERLAEDYVHQELSPEVPRGVNNVVGMLSMKGYETAVVTGNPQEMAEPTAELILGGSNGVSHVFGTEVATENGVYVARFVRNTTTDKEAAINEMLEDDRYGFDPASSVAIGDSEEADAPIYGHVGTVIHIDPEGSTSPEELRSEIPEVESEGGLLQHLLGGQEKDVFVLDDIAELKEALESDNGNGLQRAI
ncbi:MAG: HAD family hydrolase [Candidatus Nanohaloarchaea archaeon]